MLQRSPCPATTPVSQVSSSKAAGPRFGFLFQLCATTALVPIALICSATQSAGANCSGTSGNDVMVCTSAHSFLVTGGTHGDDHITIDGGSYTVIEAGRGDDTIIVNGGIFSSTAAHARLSGDTDSYGSGNTPAQVGRDLIIINGGTFTGINIYGDAKYVNVRSPNLNDDVIEINGGSVESVYGDDGFVTGTISGATPLVIGNDAIRVTGGEVKGEIVTDSDLYPSSIPGGNDTFDWSGGTIAGQLYMGRGTDTALITASGYDGSNVLNGGDDYSAADGWTDTLMLIGIGNSAAGISTMGAKLLNWEQLTVDNSFITLTDGALEVGADVGAGLLITNGGKVDAGASLALTGNVTISATSTFDATGAGAGVYSVSGSVFNDGIITTQDGVTGDAFMVTGNYVGTGMLLLDVDTTTDTADTLNIGGDVVGGGAQITVANLSPLGATGNNITLVTVGGTSSVGDFTLTGGMLTAGAYDYGLEKIGNSFVLASAINSTGYVYEIAPSVLGTFNRLPTLEQRVGERQQTEGQDTWIRVRGDRLNARNTSGNDVGSTTWGMQAGIDFDLEPSENGRWVLGVTAQYGTSSAAMTNALGAGTIGTAGFGVGATATWYGNDDLYVDVQAQANWLTSDFSSSSTGGLAADKSSKAYALSFEVGQRIALGNDRTLVPQAQITFGRVAGATFIDTAGNTVDLGSNSSTIGRLGLAYEFNNVEDGEKLYVVANVLHDFSNESTVSVMGANLSTTVSASTWGEIGLGGSYNVNENTMFYGEASYRTSLNGNASSNNGLSATAGLRIQW